MSKQNGSMPMTEVASAEVHGGEISIQKEPERREDGFVVTYTIVSSSEESLSISFDDEFEITEPENVGFHRDHAPDSWNADSECISVEHALQPDQESRLMLGIVAGDNSVPTSAVMTRPEITNIESVEGNVASSGNEATDDPSLYERAKKSLMAGNSASSSGGRGADKLEADEDDLEGADERLELDEPSEDLDLNLPEETGVGNESEELGVRNEPEEVKAGNEDATQPSDSTEEDIDESSSLDEDVKDSKRGKQADSGPEPLELELDEPIDEPADGSESGSEGLLPNGSDDGISPNEPNDRSESVCTLLVEEFESGSISEEDLDALREHLSVESSRSDGTDRGSAEDVSRSDKLRLAHVQSRLDDLSAYVEMFERFIDERGTFQEFADEADEAIDEIETELEALDASVDALQTEQSATEEDVETLRDRLGEQETTFEAEFETLERRQETTDSRLDQLEVELEAEFDEIRTQLDQFEQLAEALESVFQAEQTDALEGV